MQPLLTPVENYYVIRTCFFWRSSALDPTLRRVSTYRTDSVSIDPRRLEGILSQGALGHHVLFDVIQIRRALGRSLLTGDHRGALDELQSILTELTQCDSVHQQRAIILALPESLQDLVVRMYFHFLDQYIRRQQLTWH